MRFASDRRLNATIIGLTTGLLVALAVARALDLWWWRTHLLDSAQRRAGNLSVILGEYIRETFVTHDAALRQLAIHSAHVGGATARSEDWEPLLAAAKAGLQGIGSISVVDAGGTIVHTTQPLIKGQSRRDQYLFKQLASMAGDEMVVNRPYLRVTEPRELLIPLGRRLTTADGTFNGAVVATFSPAGPRRVLSHRRRGNAGHRVVVPPRRHPLVPRAVARQSDRRVGAGQSDLRGGAARGRRHPARRRHPGRSSAVDGVSQHRHPAPHCRRLVRAGGGPVGVVERGDGVGGALRRGRFDARNHARRTAAENRRGAQPAESALQRHAITESGSTTSRRRTFSRSTMPPSGTMATRATSS